MGVDRYHRQILLPQIGKGGQERLGGARVLIVGCGALGSVLAEQVVRAGVGFVTVVDRDLVELTNLQRQVLFDEADARENVPKALAAGKRLAAINSSVTITPVVADVHAGNVEQFVIGQRFDLLLDGTDNVQTRYLLNDVAVKHGIPWVYGACVGTEGRFMVIRPGVGPCLRCIFPQPPRPQDLPTCDTAGVLGPAAGVVASMQAAAAIKILSGNKASVAEELLTINLWSNRIHSVSTRDARREDCVCCAGKTFEFLEASVSESAVSLCGRDAIQVRPGGGAAIDLAETAKRLGTLGRVTANPYFVRCHLTEPAGIVMTLFPDARAIFQGTNDPVRGKSLYARFVGA